MKKNLGVLILSLIVSLLISCKEDISSTDEDSSKSNKSWQEVPEFANMSIRYFCKMGEALYISAVEGNDGIHSEKGFLFKVGKDQTVKKIRDMNYQIGPMTVNNDTLIIMTDKEVLYYSPSLGVFDSTRTPCLYLNHSQLEMLFT